MSEWFNEVFSSSSDKARFIAIIISAIVALLVLILNQWFTNNREHRKLLIEKIEEMYLASIDYSNAANQLMQDLISANDTLSSFYAIEPATYSRLNDAVRKMEMICGLYFPSIHFEVKDYSVNNLKVIKSAINGRRIDPSQFPLKYKESKDIIDEKEKQLKELCKTLMENINKTK